MAKHETDVTSMVFGLLFIGMAGMWGLVQVDLASWPDASRVFPIMLVGAGLLGLISSLRRGARSPRAPVATDDTAPEEPAKPEQDQT